MSNSAAGWSDAYRRDVNCETRLGNNTHTMTSRVNYNLDACDGKKILIAKLIVGLAFFLLDWGLSRALNAKLFVFKVEKSFTFLHPGTHEAKKVAGKKWPRIFQRLPHVVSMQQQYHETREKNWISNADFARKIGCCCQITVITSSRVWLLLLRDRHIEAGRLPNITSGRRNWPCLAWQTLTWNSRRLFDLISFF